MGFTVLVIGAIGKTGRRVIPQLIARGVTVRAASRTPVPARDAVEPVRFDWQDERTYQPALDGVDAIYVVGGHLSDRVRNPVAPAEAFFGRIADTGVRRMVLLSAMGVDRVPDPTDYAEYVSSLYVMSVQSGYGHGTDGAMGGLVADDFHVITGRPMTTFAEFAEHAAVAWR